MTTIILSILIISSIYFCIPNVKIGSSKLDCDNIQRKIVGAIQTYNFEHKTAIKSIDKDTFELLYQKKYLRYNYYLIKSPKCKYLIDGDIDNNGTIYCKYHGSYFYNEKEKKGIPPSKEYLIEKKYFEIRLMLMDYAPYIVFFAFLSIIVIIFRI